MLAARAVCLLGQRGGLRVAGGPFCGQSQARVHSQNLQSRSFASGSEKRNNRSKHATNSNNNNDSTEEEEEKVPRFYEILGVAPTATQEEIRKAYRDAMRRYHPDTSKNPDPQKVSDLNSVNAILSNEEKRKEYDRRAAAGDEACDDPQNFKIRRRLDIKYSDETGLLYFFEDSPTFKVEKPWHLKVMRRRQAIMWVVVVLGALFQLSHVRKRWRRVGPSVAAPASLPDPVTTPAPSDPALRPAAAPSSQTTPVSPPASPISPGQQQLESLLARLAALETESAQQALRIQQLENERHPPPSSNLTRDPLMIRPEELYPPKRRTQFGFGLLGGVAGTAVAFKSAPYIIIPPWFAGSCAVGALMGRYLLGWPLGHIERINNVFQRSSVDLLHGNIHLITETCGMAVAGGIALQKTAAKASSSLPLSSALFRSSPGLAGALLAGWLFGWMLAFPVVGRKKLVAMPAVPVMASS